MNLSLMMKQRNARTNYEKKEKLEEKLKELGYIYVISKITVIR